MLKAEGLRVTAEVMPFWRALLGYEPRGDSPDEDLVDPRKAEGQRLVFTVAAEGDPQISKDNKTITVKILTAADAPYQPPKLLVGMAR